MVARDPPDSAALKLHRFVGFGEVTEKQQRPRRHGKPPVPKPGTPLAVSKLPLGGAAQLPRRPKGRGGAHNRADRESDALTVRQVGNLLAAADHADAIGLPLTRFITIHWQSAGVPPEGMAKATGRFVDLLAKALARHGSVTAWLWVHEGGINKGGHCHLLVHVPPMLVRVVSRLQKGWLRRISGKPYRAGVIKSRPVGGRLGVETSMPAVHAINLDNVLGYALKAADAEAVAEFDLPLSEPGGRVIGKRCSTSQNIGPKARKEAKR